MAEDPAAGVHCEEVTGRRNTQSTPAASSGIALASGVIFNPKTVMITSGNSPDCARRSTFSGCCSSRHSWFYFAEISTFATLVPRRKLSVASAPPSSSRTLYPSGIATRCRRLESHGQMCVLAGDAVALHGMISVHRQRQRRAEAHAFLGPISPRGDAAFGVGTTSPESEPTHSRR